MNQKSISAKPHTKTIREPQFELLRVLLMLMMLILHYLTRADALITLNLPLTGVRITGTVIQSFLLVASNTWVLISGYFLSESDFRIWRLIELVAEVYFYTIVISLVMTFAGIPLPTDGSIFSLVQYLFPITSGHYWFVSAYVLLYLVSPVLNAGVHHLTKRQLTIVLAGLFLWFSLIKSVVPVSFVTDDYGYGFKWFVFVYLIGAYLRRYEVPFLTGKTRPALLYVLSSAAIIVLTLLLYHIHMRTGQLTYYFSVMAHYNFLLVLLASVAFFSLFRQLDIGHGRFARLFVRLSPYVLGVYLLHEHAAIRDRWFPWMEGLFGPVNTVSVPRFLLHFVCSVALLFAAGVFIDWVRAVLFSFAARLVKR